MSYKEYEAIVLPVCYRFEVKDVEKFQKAGNEKHFRFHYLEDYHVFVYTPSVKFLRRGDGWPYIASIKTEKGRDWTPKLEKIDREVSDVEKLPLQRDLRECPEIYKSPMWARVEVIDNKLSLSK